MADESSFDKPNGRSQANEWETSFHAQPHGALEHEWQQVSAAYSNPDGFLPEWENPGGASVRGTLPLPVEARDKQVYKTKRLIAHCRQIAPDIVRQLLGTGAGQGEQAGAMTTDPVSKLLARFESVIQQAEAEVSALESASLGEREFEAELGSSDEAQDLALTEVLAAEATHAETESEAQSLMATALPITISIIGSPKNMNRMLPALTQANARLTSSLFRQGNLSRQALALVPSIQRRVIAGLKNQELNGNLSQETVNQRFAVHSASILTQPTLMGRAFIRNQAIRSNTMPACPPKF